MFICWPGGSACHSCLWQRYRLWILALVQQRSVRASRLPEPFSLLCTNFVLTPTPLCFNGQTHDYGETICEVEGQASSTPQLAANIVTFELFTALLNTVFEDKLPELFCTCSARSTAVSTVRPVTVSCSKLLYSTCTAMCTNNAMYIRLSEDNR